MQSRGSQSSISVRWAIAKDRKVLSMVFGAVPEASSDPSGATCGGYGAVFGRGTQADIREHQI